MPNPYSLMCSYTTTPPDMVRHRGLRDELQEREVGGGCRGEEDPGPHHGQIIGCGTLTCMAVVTLTILLSYLKEGREVVQATILDVAFCFTAAAMLITAGGGAQ